MAWGERDVRVQLGRVLTYTHVGRARMNHQYLHGLYQPLMQQSSGLFTIALLTIFCCGMDLYTLWESNIASEHGSF